MNGDFLLGRHTLPGTSGLEAPVPLCTGLQSSLQGHKGCFSYLTQKVNSSTYYKSRDCRSKDSEESDGTDVLKEVPLGVGGEKDKRPTGKTGRIHQPSFNCGLSKAGLSHEGQGCCLPCTAGWNPCHHLSAFLSYRSLTLAQGKS